MKRDWLKLLGGIWCVSLLAAGCAGTPVVSPSDDRTSAAPTANGESGPEVQLCDARERTSLAGIATGLERADDDSADVTELSQSLANAQSNLESLETDASAEPLVEEAADAIGELLDVIDDPDARESARTRTAEALRALQDEVCSTE